jgi:MFS transporter, OPA family, sugar phosphate sensor protein UhpC
LLKHQGERTLADVQVVRPDAVGAAQGLLGWISYMGAACAGAPLALAVQKYGWNIYFTTMVAAAVVMSVLVLPMLNVKSYAQRMAEIPSLDLEDERLDAASKS